MNAEQLTAHDMGHDAGLPERRLWVAALAQMVQDGKIYWNGTKSSTATADELESAFDALVQNTWMLKRICNMTGHDAKWISQGFIRWCESNMT